MIVQYYQSFWSVQMWWLKDKNEPNIKDWQNSDCRMHVGAKGKWEKVKGEVQNIEKAFTDMSTTNLLKQTRTLVSGLPKSKTEEGTLE